MHPGLSATLREISLATVGLLPTLAHAVSFVILIHCSSRGRTAALTVVATLSTLMGRCLMTQLTHTKKRSNWGTHYCGHTIANSSFAYNDYLSWGDVSIITDSKHPFHTPYSRKKRGFRVFGDTGGAMALQRVVVSVDGAHVSVNNGQAPGSLFYSQYNGILVPNGHVGTAGSPPPAALALIPQFTMTAKGVKGWNRFKPTHPHGGIGQFIGDLRQGLPLQHSILQLKSQVKELSKLGKHGLRIVPGQGLKFVGKATSNAYLATAFDLLPAIGDLLDLVKNVRDLHKNIEQLARDNGQSVRRRGTIDNVEADSQQKFDGSGPSSFSAISMQTNLWDPSTRATMYVDFHQSTRYWFSGCFRYFIDPTRFGYKGLPSKYDFQLSRILFGLDPTDPSLYYELMPWSWLLDWVVPLGPMIDNLVNDSTDQLVAQYAYVMAHSRATEVRRVATAVIGGRRVDFASTKMTETKQRFGASPYGFGIDMSSLSGRQLGVLAALGLQKLS
jgi:hypothetical protein